MNDIQLFRLNDNTATELTGRVVQIEKSLQNLIESQMETFLGVRFLASEFATGKTHRGRIDSLGLDENGFPVIVEYKRRSDENVINQGLFYLDWLLTNRAEFYVLVMNKLGKDIADSIEWSGARLLCIAADFTRFDQYAIQQIDRNIELLRYKFFSEDLLLLELVNSQVASDPLDKPAPEKSPGKDKTFQEQLAQATPEMRRLYEQIAEFILALGDDVQEKHLKLYTAFRRLKNFASVIAASNRFLIMLRLNPDTVALEDGFSRDVSQIGHWGSGNLELTLRNKADFERAKPLIERSYFEN